MEVTPRSGAAGALYHHDGMERKQIQFTRQQLAALRREAKRRRTSESAVIREALDAWLGRRDTADRQERFERALAVVGAFRSGSHDVAVEHDRELAEIYYDDLGKKR